MVAATARFLRRRPSRPGRASVRRAAAAALLAAAGFLALLAQYRYARLLASRPARPAAMDQPAAPPASFANSAASSASSAATADICRVAAALVSHPLRSASYSTGGAHLPIALPDGGGRSPLPHVSSVLCGRRRIGTAADPAGPGPAPSPPPHSSARSVLSFKSARSGSTFFTTVVTSVLRDAGRVTTKYWEPSFCSNRNQHPGAGAQREGPYQASSLRAMLTSRCRGRPGGCRPAEDCRSAAVGDDPAYVVALNPRFLNYRDLDWADAVGGMGDGLRVFSLRRTNLVLMAYSKFHHGGCRVGGEEGGGEGAAAAQGGGRSRRRRRRLTADGTMGGGETASPQGRRRGGRRKGRGGKFTFDTLMKCVHHYAIGDQELSVSVAYAASEASGSAVDPFLILYEDVLASGELVEEGVLRHLDLAAAGGGSKPEAASVFDSGAGASSTKKVHSDPICGYDDVDCSELLAGLRGKHPCLVKQLQRADDGLTWSMPLLTDGRISVEGDCYPLPPLGPERRVRAIEELYQLRPI